MVEAHQQIEVNPEDSDPHGEDGEEDEGENDDEEAAAAAHFVGVPFLPALQQGEVAGVGFEKGGADGAEAGDEIVRSSIVCPPPA